METVMESISTLADHFNSKMTEFQRDLHKGSSPVSTASLASEFSTFKSFIIISLNTLQRQVELLGRENDRQEMRRRRKILLLHGLPEEKQENTTSKVVSLVADRLLLPNFSSASVKTSYRLGRPSDKKVRPIVVKFSDVVIRDKVWFSKKKLKGSGITQSEFLTRDRHDMFMEARRRFGINNCWTRDGNVYILSSDGMRHKAEYRSDLEGIPTTSSQISISKDTVVSKPSEQRITAPRIKRVIKK